MSPPENTGGTGSVATPSAPMVFGVRIAIILVLVVTTGLVMPGATANAPPATRERSAKNFVPPVIKIKIDALHCARRV